MGRSWALVVSVAVTASACIKPSEIMCGDEICPPDSVCLSNNTCVGADAVQACSGIADGGACTTADFTGSCTDGACTAAVCGNGIVEGSEQCDGSIGAVDCVTYGFDLGVPTCNARCDLDVVDSCTRFGWERILSVAANDAWTDGTRFAISDRNDTSSTSIYVGGAVVATADIGPWVFGNAQRVFAWNADDIAEYSGGTAFPTITSAVPDPNGGDFIQVEAAPDDAAYVLINPGCQIYRRAPSASSWDEIRASGANDCSLVRASASAVYAALDLGNNVAEVDRWSGTGETWAEAFTGDGPVADIETAPDGTQWVASYDGVGYVAGATVVMADDLEFASTVVPIGDVVYATNGAPSFDRIHGALIEQLEAPIEGVLLADATHTTLYEIGNGVYQFRGMEYSDRAPVAQGATTLAVLPDGRAVTNGGGLLFVANTDGNWDDYPSDLDNIVGLAARDFADLYITDGVELEHFVGTLTYTLVDAPFTAVTGLWMPPAGEPELYAVGAAGFTMSYDGNAWHALTPPPGDSSCDLAAITGAGTAIVAVGGVGGVGVAWQLSGTTWSEIYRGGPPLAAVSIAADGTIWAAGPAGGASFDGTTWTAQPQAAGISISATAHDDVWVGGGPNDIVHWDGSSWSRLGVSGASTPYVAATPREVYIVGASQSVLLR